MASRPVFKHSKRMADTAVESCIHLGSTKKVDIMIGNRDKGKCSSKNGTIAQHFQYLGQAMQSFWCTPIVTVTRCHTKRRTQKYLPPILLTNPFLPPLPNPRLMSVGLRNW